MFLYSIKVIVACITSPKDFGSIAHAGGPRNISNLSASHYFTHFCSPRTPSPPTILPTFVHLALSSQQGVEPGDPDPFVSLYLDYSDYCPRPFQVWFLIRIFAFPMF